MKVLDSDIKKLLLCVFILCLFSWTLNGCTSNKVKSTRDVSHINNNKNIDNDVNLSAKNIVNYLCSDEIKNRYIEKDGNKKAVKYVENIFKSLDLEYVFSSSYLHSFEYKIEKYSSKENKLIIKPLKLNNIVGKISGKTNKNAIILTAHLDSFGKGALDNASGVSTVLKIAENLKRYLPEKSCNYDVIFCITNAEMQLFKGSEAFLKDIKNHYNKLYDINIDCIGLKKGKALALKNISKIKESDKLYTSLKMFLKNNNIEFTNTVSTQKLQRVLNKNFGVSDYFTFEKNGIPNIHIAQSGIEPLPEKENDSPEILDFKKIDKFADALTQWLKDFK